LDAFERSAWAYALLAAQRLIEESGRVWRDIEPAASLLRDAKVAYSSGNLGANQDLLARLQSATQALYSEDVQRLRQILYATQDRISQTAHIGGDVVAAEEFLGHAREAMRRGEHGKSLQLLKEAERLAEEALARRVGHIAAAIPATEAMIEEARVVDQQNRTETNPGLRAREALNGRKRLREIPVGRREEDPEFRRGCPALLGGHAQKRGHQESAIDESPECRHENRLLFRTD